MWLGTPVTCSTWEEASSLPPSIVADYENGITYNVQEQSFTSGGETFRTFSSGVVEDTPDAKRSKVCSTKGYIFQLIIKTYIMYTQYFSAQPEDLTTSCNTVKDKTRINHKTAGMILAIVFSMV